MVMPKAVNGITTQAKWMQEEDIQRHNHPIAS
jgi:hypothetical protein